MAAPSLLEGCQTLIEKGHESWKSYFSKWEAFAKYEEDLPESELFSDTEEKKSSKKRKVKQTKPRRLPCVRYKKKNEKRTTRKKRNAVRVKPKSKTTEECSESNNGDLIEDMDDLKLETLLKTVFTEILKSNKSEFQMFTILSQTTSHGGTKSCQLFYQETSQHNDFPKAVPLMPETGLNVGALVPQTSGYYKNWNQRWNSYEPYRKEGAQLFYDESEHNDFPNCLQLMPGNGWNIGSVIPRTSGYNKNFNQRWSMFEPSRKQIFSQGVLQQNAQSYPSPLIPGNSGVGSVISYRNSYNKNLNQSWNTFECYRKSNTGMREQIRNSDITLPKFRLFQQISLNKPEFLPPLRQSMQVNFGIRAGSLALSSSLTNGGSKLKSLNWDSGLKSPNSVCRKINREYFINRSPLKMNLAQDGKRSRNLCLRKRTNSITLSMENSNFITPERKPPERKCFSENVSQRKRTRPSKLFFGDEDEDSENSDDDDDDDDEKGKQTPIIIRCGNKKRKTEIISEAADSDSDDCDSIFDRIKTP